jgi:hypothetical protein
VWNFTDTEDKLPQLEPTLYGIANSNRKKSDFWGKNQFNSSFPVSLACYMRDKKIEPAYICVDGYGKINSSGTVPWRHVFNTTKPNKSLTFNFETTYTPYAAYSYDNIGGVDLVVMDAGKFLRPLEIKLTVLPDSGTSRKPVTEWGSELVIRPASTKYCALGMTHEVKRAGGIEQVRDLIEPVCSKITGWGSEDTILNKKERILDMLEKYIVAFRSCQIPFLMQCLWRTEGQQAALTANAFDIFLWSDFSICKIAVEKARESEDVSRYLRAAARLARILYETSTAGKAHVESIYTEMAHGNQTDKEFALSGNVTRPYLPQHRLIKPSVPLKALKKIILNGGERELRPERRFDAAVYYAAETLFAMDEDEK